MRVLIINGPNLNLLGKREPAVYGGKSFEDYLKELKASFENVAVDYFQSNVEGEIINQIQAANGHYDGILLNAAGYTHTSVAIADAVAAIDTPVVEIHISNIYAREEVRHNSLIAKHCIGQISGLGLEGYKLALQYLMAK